MAVEIRDFGLTVSEINPKCGVLLRDSQHRTVQDCPCLYHFLCFKYWAVMNDMFLHHLLALG